MPAKMVTLTTFCKRDGSHGTRTVPMGKVKALREDLAKFDVIITSSKPVRF